MNETTNTTVSKFTYKILQLEEQELENWYDFVHSIFKAKTSREYFVNHHINDPYSSPKDILIAVVSDKASGNCDEIVGTVKIFHRLIRINNNNGGSGDGVMMKKGSDNEEETMTTTQCKCKGIGEVSTRSDCRKMGIASSLLEMQLERMRGCEEEKDDLVLSSLHVSTETSKLYYKIGWRAVPLHFSKLSFSVDDRKSGGGELVMNSNTLKIDSTNFKSHEIHRLYDQYCKFYGFCGSEVRSEEYWNSWVTHESTTHNCSSYSLFESGNLKAYIIVGPDSGSTNTSCWKLKEFVCHPNEDHGQNINYFFTLVVHALKESNDLSKEKSSFSITLPRPIAKFVFNLEENEKTTDLTLQTNTLTHNITLEKYQPLWWTDYGYMYNIVKKPSENILLVDLIDEERHLVWKTDGF